MSWLSKFMFDPIKAAVARSQTSSNPVAQATGAAAAAAIAKVSVDVSANNLSHNSVIGVKNDVVADLETGLRDVVDVFVASMVTRSVPIVGGMVAPEAVSLANGLLVFAEQHALTYVSALFSHHSAQVNSTVPVLAPPAPQAVAEAQQAA